MATTLEWPTAVLAAASIKFTAPVSAILWLPEVQYPCLVGRVFMDLSGRFADGRLIRTSGIIALIEEGNYTIARTFAGSHYVLVEPAGNLFAGLQLLPQIHPHSPDTVH